MAVGMQVPLKTKKVLYTSHFHFIPTTIMERSCAWRHLLLCEIFLLTILLSLSIGSSQEIDCTGDPCMYGICLDNNSSYSCYCIDGYTGINCEINWDDCWSDPCLNGGTCNDAVAAYNCTCVEGFIGTNCEQKYSECTNQPCLNNGTCIDYDGFICQCPDGYSGDYCEIDASVCNDTICKNSGECMEGPGFSFFCRCPEGWSGRLCDEDVDECVTSPCKNGGLCINVPASYTCACLFGYTGKDCDKVIVPCNENPCENGAVCLLEDDRPVCYCVPDYHGVFCELKYDDCESKFANCENGGTCIDGVNSFTCACPAFYSGILCDVYDLPFTTPLSTEGVSVIDNNGEAITAVSSSPTASSLPESTVSFSATSQVTEYPLISFTSASDSHAISSASTEASTFKLERNATDIFSDDSTETTPLLSDASAIYSTSPNEASHDATMVFEQWMFSSTEGESSRAFSTTKIQNETEYFTQKSVQYDAATKEVVRQNGRAETSAPVSHTMNGETTEYTTTINYSSIVTTSFEKGMNNMTLAGEDESSMKPSTTTLSSIVPEFWQNRSSELSTTMINVPKTTSESFLDQQTTTTASKPSIADFDRSSSSFLSTVSLPTLTYTTNTSSTVRNTTMFNENAQKFTTEDQILTSTTAESPECRGSLCTTPTVLTTHNEAECNCSQRGEDCRTRPKLTQVAFNGKSYVRQRVDIDSTNSNNATLHVFVKLKTRFKSGIILHAYFDDEKYALIHLELGSLKFQFSCGLDTMLLGEIDSPVDNGYDVDIDVRFQYFLSNGTNKCSARLLVNDTSAVSGEQILPETGNLPKHANLHLGGIPTAFSHYFSHVAMGFVGCMDSLKINEMPRHFIYDSIETFQIEDCLSFLCLSNPCHNFGACEEIYGGVRCRCIAGYTGIFCERSVCDESPCALGATCISSPGTGFVCVCPLGTHGLLCEEDTVIARPSFSVLVPGFSSYVAYAVSNSIKNTMELTMRIIPRTTEQISLIAYLGQSGSRRGVSDHFSITYVRGYIMVTWDLGAGVRRIFTSVPLSTATITSPGNKSYKPYTIRVGRRGRDAWLAVDGIGNVTGRVRGSMTQLDVSPILYIGGHKSRNFESLPHDLPLHSGFSGCIFDIELHTDSGNFPIISSSPATGRGVGECHRNECIRHSCKNGAVCLNHGATYSCICTKEWMGSDCSTPVDVSTSITPACHTAG